MTHTPLALLPFLAVLLACQTAGHKPVWADEFDYAGSPDSARWTYDLGDGCPNVCGWGNNEAQFYTNDLRNIRVENGMLIIEAHRDSLGGKPYTSARIVSRQRGDFLYGRVEVRARLPHGRGTWPALWMLSTDWSYGGWPASGEIDIMEHVGYDPGVIHGTIHTETYNHIQQTQKEGKVQIPDASETFHVYAIDWTPDRIDFWVDDQRYHRVERAPTDTPREWPFDKRFHLIMNIAVGGNWGGLQGIDESIWPQRMEIDYVRVYE